MNDTERVLYFQEGKIMKTVICDDEKSTCSELEEIILKYAKEKSVSLVTEVFYSGDTLLDYLKREKYAEKNKMVLPDIMYMFGFGWM